MGGRQGHDAEEAGAWLETTPALLALRRMHAALQTVAQLSAPRCFAFQVLDEQLTDLLRCLPDNPAMHEKVGCVRARLVEGHGMGTQS